jgi:enoyl-CoA hydratase/carnithine racemase
MPRAIHYEVEGPIATVTIEGFNKYNAITSQMFGELADAFFKIDADRNVRVAILRGHGSEHFSTGADLKETEERRSRNNVASYSAPHALARQRRNFWFPHARAGLTSRLRQTSNPSLTPFIAAIPGYCLAAAMIVAFYRCSLRIAGASAKFGFPEIRFGGGQGIGMSTLPRQVAFAPLQLLASGMEYVDAPTALTMGLVNEVVPDDTLFARVREIAERVAEAPRLNLMAEKKGLRMADHQQQATIGSIASMVSSFVHLGLDDAGEPSDSTTSGTGG